MLNKISNRTLAEMVVAGAFIVALLAQHQAVVRAEKKPAHGCEKQENIIKLIRKVSLPFPGILSS